MSGYYSWPHLTPRNPCHKRSCDRSSKTASTSRVDRDNTVVPKTAHNFHSDKIMCFIWTMKIHFNIGMTEKKIHLWFNFISSGRKLKWKLLRQQNHNKAPMQTWEPALNVKAFFFFSWQPEIASASFCATSFCCRGHEHEWRFSAGASLL